MWNVDLENSAGNRADTIGTQDNTDIWRVRAISPSGKVVATVLLLSYNVEFLDINTWEVIARTNVEYKDRMGIVFSPDDS